MSDFNKENTEFDFLSLLSINLKMKCFQTCLDVNLKLNEDCVKECCYNIHKITSDNSNTNTYNKNKI